MIKRVFDFICSLIGLVFMGPFLVLVAIVIKIFDGGAVFFIQERVGRGGRPFRIVKFRTMITDRSGQGAPITARGDSRITPLGYVLRKFKIDELPQLWNVLRGEMSLVGPRPEVARFVDCYTPTQRKVLELKPGVTDPASFAFFDEAELLGGVADPERFYREQVMVEKIRINLDYAAKSGFYTDLVLIAVTVARAVGYRFDLFGWLGIKMPDVRVGM